MAICDRVHRLLLLVRLLQLCCICYPFLSLPQQTLSAPVPLLSTLIIFSSTPHCITLLPNALNLFWGITVSFSLSLLFLQLQARCPNPLQLKHNFSLFPSSSSLSLVREHFSLSKLLISELYCCKDMVLCLCKEYRFND